MLQVRVLPGLLLKDAIMKKIIQFFKDSFAELKKHLAFAGGSARLNEGGDHHHSPGGAYSGHFRRASLSRSLSCI
jgi:hypothetical protein